MANTARPDLKEMSYEQLLQLFVNAVGLIVKEKQVSQAKEIINCHQHEWARRRVW